MKTIPQILCTLAAVTLSLVAAEAQLIDYEFNEGSGSTAANSGSVGSAQDLTLGSTSGWTSGVSGAVGDSAYSNTTFNNVNSYATSANPFTSLNGGNAVTIAGWIYLPSAGYSLTGTVLQASATGNGITLRQNGSNLQFINSSGFSGSTMQSTGGSYGSLDTWTFFAVTWDGSLTSDAVNFYYGGTATAVTSDSQVAKVGGSTVATISGVLAVGNTSTPGQFNAVVGSLDNIEIYNSVLTQSQLETLRSSALVPEPSILGLLGAAGLAFILRRRTQDRSSWLA